MARDFFPGVGQAVAERTVLRPGEGWGDVAKRVALGNTSLRYSIGEDKALEEFIAEGRILMSGRHLQHGDAMQTDRPMEVFTNCSTASQRALLFYLLLNGSGVGTSYDDHMQVVDWNKMPNVVCIIDAEHADADGEFPSTADGDFYFAVPDSREGWAEAVQFVEDLTFYGQYADSRVVIDFSDVRPKGAPIGGMQGRPSSGPVPLMQALMRFNQVKAQRLPLWRQAMELDHLLAEIVLVGGARRAARIAVKWWEDDDILDYINAKQHGGLWTANNSVGVDALFWDLVRFGDLHATRVFNAIIEANYQHGTGEPGFLNLDLISKGEEPPTADDALDLDGAFEISPTAIKHRGVLLERAATMKYCVIVNPCGEIRLSVNGAYCVIADVTAAFCENQEQLNTACRLAARALMRTNLMTALYAGEVKRTNRIGVGLTGIHEYAWSRFGLTFRDLIKAGEGIMKDANGNDIAVPDEKARPFWYSLFQAACHVEDVVHDYAEELGVAVPVTRRTIKPAGTTSKLFGLTEGAHLPSMREYLRWVQFRSDAPLVDQHEAAGYPVRRELATYPNVSIVGFPTRLLITEMMGDDVVTAAEATPEEQIRWIRLLETYWLLGNGGNQISYTLKYDPAKVSEAEYRAFMMDSVPLVRAVSIMPQVDATAYEYQPEEPITAEEYDRLMAKITPAANEDIGLEHVDCASGACPVDFRTAEAA